MPKLTVWTDETGVHMHADGVTPVELLGLTEYARLQAVRIAQRDTEQTVETTTEDKDARTQ